MPGAPLFAAAPIAGKVIGAVGSLLGGLLGKSKPKYVIPPYQQIREQAEAAGFNPLFALSNAPGAVGQESSNLGQGIADAAAQVAGMLDQKNPQAVNEQLVTQNQRLQDRVTRLTLRPPVPSAVQRGAFDEVAAQPSSGLAFAPDVPRVAPDPFTGRDRVAYPGGVSAWGYDLSPAPGFDDAETLQTRYGDGVEFIGGIGNLVADTVSAELRNTQPSAAEVAASRPLPSEIVPPSRPYDLGGMVTVGNRQVMGPANRAAMRDLFRLVPPSSDETWYPEAGRHYRNLMRRYPARAF